MVPHSPTPDGETPRGTPQKLTGRDMNHKERRRAEQGCRAAGQQGKSKSKGLADDSSMLQKEAWLTADGSSDVSATHHSYH